ncbi:photosynthetic protein synthase I [Geomonas limicola]|uniref:Photosynthetic protein synthase I n=1 Tax=Geomonas limicola TaxID=2740186 RepID=A0A6V8NAW7_9BACT|nr:SCO family protein [Geomonas limicola]GFO69758.1 photosynthetic protein synthase I [Geomonas limicola]
MLIRALRQLLLVVLLLQVPFPSLAWGHSSADQVLSQIGVDEHPGGSLPLQTVFRDPTGRPVRLSDNFSGVPVLLSLNYYACPTLCPLVFRNLAETLAELGDLKLGRDFRIVTLSINPDESPALAQDKSGKTYAMLKEVVAPERYWPFLMGDQQSIAALARSVGVRYLKQESGDYAHPNVLVVLTPEGKISRYLYGLVIRPRDLRLALVEAAGGKIGSSEAANRLLLYCFHYDPVGKKYVLFASRLMTLAMLSVLALTGLLLALLWKKERVPRSPDPSNPTT